jgi:hypothetical protein
MSDRQSGEVLDHFSGHTPTPVLAVAVATSLCSAGFLEEFFSETRESWRVCRRIYQSTSASIKQSQASSTSWRQEAA